MNRTLWSRLPVVAVLFFFALTGVILGPSLSTAQEAAPEVKASGPIKVGQEVKDFATVDSEGKKVSEKDFLGKPTALVFFQSACSICTSEIKTVRDIKAHKKDLTVILISLDMRQPADNYAMYRKNYAGDLPIWLIGNSGINQRLEAYATPAIALVDSAGKLVEMKLGYHAKDKLELEKKIMGLK